MSRIEAEPGIFSASASAGWDIPLEDLLLPGVLWGHSRVPSVTCSPHTPPFWNPFPPALWDLIEDTPETSPPPGSCVFCSTFRHMSLSTDYKILSWILFSSLTTTMYLYPAPSSSPGVCVCVLLGGDEMGTSWNAKDDPQLCAHWEEADLAEAHALSSANVSLLYFYCWWYLLWISPDFPFHMYMQNMQMYTNSHILNFIYVVLQLFYLKMHHIYPFM